MRRLLLPLLALGAMLCVAATPAVAQDYPNRPIKFVVPYGAGTGADIAARTIAAPLSKELGQPIIVENRPGAVGGIAAGIVLNAPADGYTVLAHVSSLTSVPAFAKNPTFAVKDFAGVTLYADLPLVLVISPAKGIKSLKELIAAAKAKPGSISFASAGIGTATYISAERLAVGAGIDVLHVPYKSTTDAMADVLAGRVDFLFTQTATALGQIKEGKLLGLAVTSKRSSTLPDVPTVIELGFPNAYFSLWAGLMVSAKTPKDVIQRLYRAVEKIKDQPDFKQQVVQMGGEVYITSPEETDTVLAREAIENAQLVKTLGIEKE